jgi:4-amino-4-deoxychorismate lyase
MELAVEYGLQCKEEIVSLNRLYSADEVFVTNSVIGLWPVQAIDAHVFRPGEVTQAITDGISAVQSQIQI